MNERSESMAILSFNPETDFEIRALESEICEAEADVIIAEEAFCKACGIRKYGYSSSLESLLDCMIDGEIFMESDCDCDDEDDEDEDNENDELSDEAVEAYIALEAANETFGEKMRRWWKTLKNKFLSFIRKITESVTNLARSFQVKIASLGMKDSDDIYITSEDKEKMDLALGNEEKLFNAVSKIASGNYDPDVVKELENVINNMSNPNKRTGTAGDARSNDPIKLGEVKTNLKKVSNILKKSNTMINSIDRSLEIEIDKAEKSESENISRARVAVGSALDGMTKVAREAFSGIIGAIKATKKEKRAAEKGKGSVPVSAAQKAANKEGGSTALGPQSMSAETQARLNARREKNDAMKKAAEAEKRRLAKKGKKKGVA